MAVQNTGLYVKINDKLLRRLNKLVADLRQRRGDEQTNRSQIVRELIEAALVKEGL